MDHHLSNYKLLTISKILKVKHGKNQKNVENAEGKYPILGSGGIMGFADEYLWDKPSVLIGRKGTINKPIFMDTPFWTVDTLFYTDIFQGYDPKWVYYKFQSINWLKYNEASGVPSLSASTIESILLRVPPFEEQKAIANILSTWDRAIELREKLIKEHESMVKTTYFEVYGSLNEKKEHKISTLSQVVKITKGKQLNRIDMVHRGKFPVINGGISPSGYTTQWNTSENTITISEGGNSCGYVNFIRNKFWCGGHCYKLELKNNSIDKHFLYHYLRYRQKRIMLLRVGSGLPNIQKSDISKLDIPLTDIKTQKDIGRAFELAFKQMELIKAELTMIKKQKKALMQQLLTGKIRVNTAPPKEGDSD